jgi:hypothetical protein
MGIEPTTALLKLSGVEPLGHLDGVTENQQSSKMIVYPNHPCLLFVNDCDLAGLHALMAFFLFP